MIYEKLSSLSDEEILAEAKKMKQARIIHALLIGFMVGIVVYSVAKNTWGLLTLIPLFFIYKLTGKSDHNDALKKIMKERNLQD
jgi:hypothetical protein